MYSPRAIADLRTFLARVAADDPGAVTPAAQRIFQAVGRLTGRTAVGPIHRLRSGVCVRSWPVPPLRIYYRRTRDTLPVLRIYRTTAR